MIFEYKEPDFDLLIKCLIENSCIVTKAKDGEGGIYLKGKKLTDEELMDCIMHPWEDSETMSVLIKGMEMPSRRESCPFCSVVANDEPLCDLFVGELCLFGVACPLVPVPPHGRLIDADALAAEMKKRQTEAGKWLREAKDHDTAVRADAVLSFLCEVKLTLDKMPTIIEAEEGET